MEQRVGGRCAFADGSRPSEALAGKGETSLKFVCLRRAGLSDDLNVWEAVSGD